MGVINSEKLIEEIKAFAQNVDARKFEYISKGIGLGELVPVSKYRREPAVQKEAAGRPMQSWVKSQILNGEGRNITMMRRRVGLFKRVFTYIIAHILDLFVVALTSVAMLFAVELVLKKFGGYADSIRLFQGTLHVLGYSKMIVGLYLVFSFYFVVLSLLSGGTIGGVWRKKTLHRATKIATQKIKN